MDGVLWFAILDLVLLVVVRQGHSRDLHHASLVDQLAPFLQRIRGPLSESLGLQDVREVELAHLALLADDLPLGLEFPLEPESANDGNHAVVLQPQLFRNIFNACLSLLKVNLIYITAAEPHLNRGQLLIVVDLRLAEMFAELLLIEVGDLWIEPEGCRVLLIFAAELLMD